jgi:hypothetical protein
MSEQTINYSPKIDLKSEKPQAPGYATSLQIFSLDNSLCNQFRIGESWKVILNFKLSEPTIHVIGSVGLLTLDSFPIITYWSEPKDLLPGKYQIEFFFDIPLASGEFQLGLGLSSNEVPFYYVSEIGRIKVSDIAIGAQPHRTANTTLLVDNQRPEITNNREELWV